MLPTKIKVFDRGRVVFEANAQLDKIKLLFLWVFRSLHNMIYIKLSCHNGTQYSVMQITSHDF